MHQLSRQVRFSVNPFLQNAEVGFNSHCGKPSGQGLAIYLALRVQLWGKLNIDTGFVVNIVEIDKVVKSLIVPVFDEIIGRCYRSCKHVSLSKLSELLTISKSILSEYFDDLNIGELVLDLNPARKFGTLGQSQGEYMFFFAEKFEFAAMHKLWNDKFDEKQNYHLFGKCANPTGHGHNYTAEFRVEILPDKVNDFGSGQYQKIIKENFVDLVDHKNLNADVDFFVDNNPTVENIAKFAYKKLKGKFVGAKLKEVTIWETDRTCCSYCE